MESRKFEVVAKTQFLSSENMQIIIHDEGGGTRGGQF